MEAKPNPSDPEIKPELNPNAPILPQLTLYLAKETLRDVIRYPLFSTIVVLSQLSAAYIEYQKQVSAAPYTRTDMIVIHGLALMFGVIAGLTVESAVDLAHGIKNIAKAKREGLLSAEPTLLDIQDAYKGDLTNKRN